jgi:hypothetical protein
MLETFIGALVEQSSLRLAVAGDGAGGLAVSGRPNTIYARLGASDGAVAEVHISAVSPAIDDVIYLQRENPLRPAGWRMVFWVRNGSDATLPAPLVGM